MKRYDTEASGTWRDGGTLDLHLLARGQQEVLLLQLPPSGASRRTCTRVHAVSTVCHVSL